MPSNKPTQNPTQNPTKKQYLSKHDREVIQNFFRNWRPKRIQILSEYNPKAHHIDRVKFDSEEFIKSAPDKKLFLDIEFSKKPESPASFKKTADNNYLRVFEMQDIDNEVYLEKTYGFELPFLAVTTTIKQDDELTYEDRKILGIYDGQLK